MKNLAIVTARSGSKGVKDKNIKPIGGKPMLAYSIEAALESGIFKKVMVSTDSQRYADISAEYGAEVPFLRSEETSGDTAGSWDVVNEVLRNYRMQGEMFDTICLLQPTSPLRTASDIVGAYDMYREKNADAVTGVCECDHPAEYMMTLGEDRSLEEFRHNEVDLPRQLLPVYYRLNGAIFIRRVEYTEEDVRTVADHEYAYIMDRKRSIDIDTIEDYEYAEFLMNRG